MQNEIGRLADVFGAAALDGEMWLPALTAFAEATNSSRGELIGIDGSGSSWFNWITDFSPQEVAAFAANHGPLANTRVRVSMGDPLMKVRSEVDYRAVPDDIHSRAYADFCERTEIPNGCQMKLAEDENGLIGLAVLRTQKDGATSAEDRALFSAVAPHARAAVRLQMALEQQGTLLMNGMLEKMATAAFICGPDGKLRACTPAAEAMLHSGRLKRVDARLTAASLRDDMLLQRAMQRHAAPEPQPMETLVIGVRPGGLPLMLDVCALPRAAYRLSLGNDVLVIARDSRRWHGAATTILGAVYRLSAAETDVALRLASGESRDTIAATRGTSLETVRAQLKSIFVKLGVSREAELIVMLGDLLRV